MKNVKSEIKEVTKDLSEKYVLYLTNVGFIIESIMC